MPLSQCRAIQRFNNSSAPLAQRSQVITGEDFLTPVPHRQLVKEFQGTFVLPTHQTASDLKVALEIGRVGGRKRDAIIRTQIAPLLTTFGVGETNVSPVEGGPNRRDLRLPTGPDSGYMPNGRYVEKVDM